MSDEISARPQDDWFKFVAAVTMAAQKNAIDLVELRVTDATTRRLLISVLAHPIENALAPAVEALPDGRHYSTGWPVVTREDLGPDCGCAYTHVWHFDRRHEANKPRELLAQPCPRGGWHRLFITAPGELDVVTEGGSTGA